MHYARRLDRRFAAIINLRKRQSIQPLLRADRARGIAKTLRLSRTTSKPERISNCPTTTAVYLLSSKVTLPPRSPSVPIVRLTYSRIVAAKFRSKFRLADNTSASRSLSRFPLLPIETNDRTGADLSELIFSRTSKALSSVLISDVLPLCKTVVCRYRYGELAFLRIDRS
jgi:hypothetical protein